jgi:hypothetical protein
MRGMAGKQGGALPRTPPRAEPLEPDPSCLWEEGAEVRVATAPWPPLPTGKQKSEVQGLGPWWGFGGNAPALLAALRA